MSKKKDKYIWESTNYAAMMPATSAEEAAAAFRAGLPEGEEFTGVYTIPEFMAKGGLDGLEFV